jgi:hypothetical protein
VLLTLRDEGNVGSGQWAFGRIETNADIHRLID